MRRALAHKIRQKEDIIFTKVFWYSFGRLFLEGMRNPNYILYVIPNVLGISQLVAILFMIAAVSAFVVLQVKAKKDNEI